MRIVKSASPAHVPARLSTLLAIMFTAGLSFFSGPNFAQAETPDRIAGALTGGPTVALTGNVHRKAQPQYDLGPADPALKLGYVTLLTVPTASQQKELKQLLADQQNPKSPSYRKWLTPEQYADRFGLSNADVQKITTWLQSRGFKVVDVASSRNWIAFSGTAAQAQSAFGTEFHRYNVNGEMHVANATPPRIPASLSGIVVGMRGLHDFYLKPRAVKNARAVHSNYYDNIFPHSPPDFLAPGDLATIYDINALYNATPPIDGTGQRLAIIGQTDVYLSDLNDFRSGFGLTQITGCTSDSTSNLLNGCTTSSTANFQYVLVGTDPNAPSVLGDITEADLDLEWSAAIARGAQIIYVNAPIIYNGNTYVSGGVTEAWYYAVSNMTPPPPVISLSYGSCEFYDNFVLDASGNPLADELELMQANSEGITFFNSSGDSGAAECDTGTNSSTNPANLAVGGLAVSYPAGSPEVTGVGGTAVDFTTGFSSTYWGTTNGTDGGSAQNPPIPETSWNDDEELGTAYGNNASYWQENYAIVSSGGGPSNCAEQSADNATCVAGFGQPSWQTVTLSGQAPARFSPDVSLLGSPNFPGYIFCTPQNYWVPNSTNTSSTCVSGIDSALRLTDPSGNAAPSLVGGTSASTPIMAGIMTLINQYLGTTTGLGNINPTLYVLASTPSNGVFHPVTTGDNKVYCEVGQPAGTTTDPWPTAMQCPTSGVFGYSASTADSTTGYNMVTGLGSVDAANLASNWSAASTTAGTTFTLTPTVASFQVAQGSTANATVNVTVPSGFSGTIVFTCTDNAPASTCTVPPSTNVSGQVSFSISTTLPSASLRTPFERSSRIFYAALLPGLFGIVLVAGSKRRAGQSSARGVRLMGLLIILGCSSLWLASCGGSSSSSGGGGGGGNPGTTKGNYTITVTGTSGSTAVPASFTLVVQ